MPDFIPRADPEFDLWQATFVSALSANPPAYGLVAADLTPLAATQTTWTVALPAHLAAANAAQAAREAKDDARQALVDVVRAVVRKVSATPSVTDAARAAAGMTIPDAHPTPGGPPTTVPVGTVDTSVRLQHTVHFADAGKPTSKAKPAGVRGCEIYMKVGAPAPVNESDLRFVALDSKTPYVVHFDGADAGKPVVYWLRWSSTRGEPGPWGGAGDRHGSGMRAEPTRPTRPAGGGTGIARADPYRNR